MWSLVAEEGVGDAGAVARMIEDCSAEVEAFFGEPYATPFEARVVGTHEGLERLAREKWQAPELPCWAVAMGSGSGLMMIEPTRWAEESCEHRDDGEEQVRGILRHELVHVYHGQHHVDSEFMESDAIGWYIEGLAVYASGQLDEKRIVQAQEAVSSGQGPVKVEDAWSGAARYAIAGSMAKFIDERTGGERRIELLSSRTTPEILAAAGFEAESGFLEAWGEWLGDIRSE